MRKSIFSLNVAVLLAAVALLGVISGGCGGSSSSGNSTNLTAGSTVALDFDDEEAIYNVFLAEYNGWNDVDATQTAYTGSVSVPAFIHSRKLPNAATPDTISVNLSAGTEYTVEFSKNLCESLGRLLPDIRLYAPDGSEVAASSFEQTVYPEEDPSIICFTFTPSAAGIYTIYVFSAAGDVDNDGYVLRVYKEMRNPDAGNKAGYPVRYTVSNSDGKTGIVTADDIIQFRRLLLAGVEAYESYFNLLPIDEEHAKALMDQYGFYTYGEIPGGTYGPVADAVPAVAVMATIIARNDVPEDAVYNLVKGIFDYQEDISAGHDTGKELSLETAVSGIDIDFHPGAAKYFTEQGAM